ncbi:MAG: pantoate--beta-alanine ligase [Methyloprofundus sp.]|nr:MAG: pantoate--beta-alanine ligase [Methyloprofundus sp.]
MTDCLKEITALRRQVQQWHQQGKGVAFVPTMGNLHTGHLQLVRAAKEKAERVVVSIFVNPTQFGEGEDFASYPRTEQADLDKLQALAVDIVFMPSIAEMYPNQGLTTVSVDQVSDNYCGAVRPGHFDGVVTVVSKLFNIVQADYAFFGEKDFQQLAVIRTMVSDLNMPTEVIAVPTEREVDGLAMSSRNGYLSAEQRQQAPQLYQTLCLAKAELLAKQLSIHEIEQKYHQALVKQGFAPDYFSVCRRSDLQAATATDAQLIILVAARIGGTRLIDNVQVDYGN